MSRQPKYKAVSKRRPFMQDFLDNKEYYLSNSAYVPDTKRAAVHWYFIRLEVFQSDLFLELVT